MTKIEINGNGLTLGQVYDVALHGREIQIAPEARRRMEASRAVIEKLLESGATAYGINTGFGKLATVRIPQDQIRQLQVNLVRSHACGVGAPPSEATGVS